MKNSFMISALTTGLIVANASVASAQQIFLFNSSRIDHNKVESTQPVKPNRQITAKSKIIRNDNLLNKLAPTTIVLLGYQGYFANQGIPSNEGFTFAVKTGKVNAQSLVKSAIDQGRLAPELLEDQAYLNQVQAELERQNRF